MKLPKGIVCKFKYNHTSIEMTENELITCEDCKYLACTLNGERRYCTQHEHAVKLNEWCNRAEKSKYSKTGGLELKECILEEMPALSQIMRDSMYALAGYYEDMRSDNSA